MNYYSESFCHKARLSSSHSGCLSTRACLISYFLCVFVFSLIFPLLSFLPLYFFRFSVLGSRCRQAFRSRDRTLDSLGRYRRGLEDCAVRKDGDWRALGVWSGDLGHFSTSLFRSLARFHPRTRGRKKRINIPSSYPPPTSAVESTSHSLAAPVTH
jgi:hypothetical protein